MEIFFPAALTGASLLFLSTTKLISISPTPSPPRRPRPSAPHAWTLRSPLFPLLDPARPVTPPGRGRAAVSCRPRPGAPAPESITIPCSAYASPTTARRREKNYLTTLLLPVSAMASSEPFAKQGRRVEPVRAAASSIGALPLDALYDILLHLPAKELCRLRVVSRSWRSLLSDPAFAAAHSSRHPEPLLIVGYNNNNDDGGWTERRRCQSVIKILDLSGQTVKNVRTDGHITSISLDLACVKKTGDGSSRLVNPATGAVHRVPDEDPAYGYGDRLCLFGQIASTKEYKVLRKVSYSLNGNTCVLFEICTICRNGSVHPPAQWRVIQDPPQCIDWCEKASVVIQGVVFFLTMNSYSPAGPGTDTEQARIVAFDLETERWRPRTIRGPQNLTVSSENNNLVHHQKLSLANLNGSLVTVHLPPPSMDIWYLLDAEKGLWVKQYSVQIEELDCSSLSFRPLIVLDDGRVVVHVEGFEALEIYDPRTNRLSRVAETEESCAVSVYTGTLLSLEW